MVRTTDEMRGFAAASAAGLRRDANLRDSPVTRLFVAPNASAAHQSNQYLFPLTAAASISAMVMRPNEKP